MIDIEALDRSDPLAELRQQFLLPEGILYFDGNSLGALHRNVPARMHHLLYEQWGNHLIQGWLKDGWMDLPSRVGARIAPLIGALPNEVTVADSTSVNLFKVLHAALSTTTAGGVILTDTGNFPTDLYIIHSVADTYPDVRVLTVPPADVFNALDEHPVAVVCLTHVNYRTGAAFDLETLTRRAHERGARVIVDLSHSTGVFPLALHDWGIDFAVGCGYKFLNGGPGAPAFLYVHERYHSHDLHVAIPGWIGHHEPFAFSLDYTPAEGVRRFLAGTPYVLSLAALDAALTVYQNLDLHAVYAKVHRMVTLFAELVKQHCHDAFTCLTPLDYGAHGSQISLAHPQAESIIQQLANQGIMADFRPPNVLRFGLSPLYNRYADIAKVVNALGDILNERS